MSRATALVELGERYAALGLPAAARGAFEQALAVADDGEAGPAMRLAELALVDGDGRRAQGYAELAAKRQPGPTSRLLLGRAQLAAGESAGARFNFAALIDHRKTPPMLRVRAMLGRARVAEIEGDMPGACANIMAALDLFIETVTREDCADDSADREIGLIEEILGKAVELSRGQDAGQRIAELAERRPGSPVDLLRGLWLAARHSHGDPSVLDIDVVAALAAEVALRPSSRATRLRLSEARLRRRYRDNRARQAAIDSLEELRGELEDDGGPSDMGAGLELARVYLLLAAVYEDDPADAEKAEHAYRRSLELRPGYAAAANRLAMLHLSRGDLDGALGEIVRALRLDPGHGLAWRNAVRYLELDQTDGGSGIVRILDAARPGAGATAAEVVPRFLSATADVARSDALAGMHARGHRLKNLLSIVGSRTRSARKLAGDGELGDRLNEVESALTSLYEEWATFLRSMQTTPVIEVVPVGALVREVVESARVDGSVPVVLEIYGATPDLRGDRMLLREALANIVVNAVEACAGNGEVKVSVRTEASSRTPRIEIEVKDSGPGIPRGEVSKIFSPGFTTKVSGSGVGLAIAERVVSAHYGRIVVDSGEGCGTTITVILPCDLGGFANLAAMISER